MAYWWDNLLELRTRTQAVYDSLKRDCWQVTAEKMIQLRKWKTTELDLIPILKELSVYYVPKKLHPGPMFVFPQYDAAGRPTRAQTKPLHTVFGTQKYHTIGLRKENFFGPVWFGNSDETLELILSLREVVLVEGPFDLIAARVCSSGIPVMSTLTKSLGDRHIDYLKILGVERIHLLYDNETSGAGRKSMVMLKKVLDIQTEPMGDCPGGDPSGALETVWGKGQLRTLLNSAVVDTA